MTTKFLIHRLIPLRRFFTGEVHGEAKHPVTRAVEDINATDRQQLAALLHVDIPALVRSGAEVPDVPEHLRCAFLPDAQSTAQQELEAGLFTAAGAAARHLQFRLPASLSRPAHIVRGVQPEPPPHAPVVHLDDFALGPLLFELLPREGETEVLGVPGLRHRRCGRGVELFLVDVPEARVLLAGVDKKHWSDAMEFAEDSATEPISWLGSASPTHLTSQEQEQLDTGRRVAYASPRLASALFRRSRLFRETTELRVFGGPTEQRIVWSKGPSCTDVAVSLLHPLFGLPGAFKDQWLESHSASLIKARHTQERSRPWSAPRLLLKRDESASTEVAERFRKRVQSWDENPWLTWENKRAQSLGAHARTAEARRSESPVVARASYTSEALASAAKGLGTNGAIGLDACSDTQRRFRALLAVHIFNAGQIGAPPKRAGVHTITAYNLNVSPRHNELVLFTNAADNVTDWLVPRTNSDFGVPGMRLQSRPNGGTYRLIHLPTGARLTVTSRDEDGMDAADEERWPSRDWFTVDVPVSRQEQTSLASIPPMSDDIIRLLSALAVRICTKHPRKQWALGTWAWDPLGRNPRPSNNSGDTLRSLWGANDDWELRWEGYPFPDDVVASLTDAVIGLDGIEVAGMDPIYDIALNDAVVHVRHWPAAASKRLGGQR